MDCWECHLLFGVPTFLFTTASYFKALLGNRLSVIRSKCLHRVPLVPLVFLCRESNFSSCFNIFIPFLIKMTFISFVLLTSLFQSLNSLLFYFLPSVHRGVLGWLSSSGLTCRRLREWRWKRLITWYAIHVKPLLHKRHSYKVLWNDSHRWLPTSYMNCIQSSMNVCMYRFARVCACVHNVN